MGDYDIICGVTRLDPQFCRAVALARRCAKLSQRELADEVGCKQSALSMFESGDGTKLNDEVINRIAKKFSLALPKESGGSDGDKCPSRGGGAAALPARGFCPNPECPSNHAYEVSGRRLYRPDREAADPVGARYCAICGEVLERRCPNCGAAVHEGAICSFCGDAYVI